MSRPARVGGPRMALLGAAAFALSGCFGGSGGEALGGRSIDQQAPDLAQASRLVGALSDISVDADDAPRVGALLGDVASAARAEAPAASALVGTASYAGDFLVREVGGDGQESLLGDFALSVNFDDASLTGRLGETMIINNDDRRLIAATDADITGTVDGRTMTATLDGRITVGENVAAISGAMAGGFAGLGAETVAGGMTLDVDGDDGVPEPFEGVFAGDRAPR
ncbi:hypothetical protein CCR87_06465 [Rhodobaculum claviforme]|uniref:Transferrin-binding protein B C-lobe/N-lobe beta barrel domain-containing protein n=2 Tax=Rhodobaculum claviforme TaxID=1549854 RepID=A0A934TK38_9RHOB|nr:hypothetical protein [Rhodobaculum claviforme]